MSQVFIWMTYVGSVIYIAGIIGVLKVEDLRNQLDVANYKLKIAKDNFDMSITNAKTFQKFVLGMKD